MTKYEVLYWYNAETQERDIRCRSDIDKHPVTSVCLWLHLKVQSAMLNGMQKH